MGEKEDSRVDEEEGFPSSKSSKKETRRFPFVKNLKILLAQRRVDNPTKLSPGFPHQALSKSPMTQQLNK